MVILIESSKCYCRWIWRRISIGDSRLWLLVPMPFFLPTMNLFNCVTVSTLRLCNIPTCSSSCVPFLPPFQWIFLVVSTAMMGFLVNLHIAGPKIKGEGCVRQSITNVNLCRMLNLYHMCEWVRLLMLGCCLESTHCMALVQCQMSKRYCIACWM